MRAEESENDLYINKAVCRGLLLMRPRLFVFGTYYSLESESIFVHFLLTKLAYAYTRLSDLVPEHHDF